jgi:hypothetical protein
LIGLAENRIQKVRQVFTILVFSSLALALETFSLSERMRLLKDRIVA